MKKGGLSLLLLFVLHTVCVYGFCPSDRCVCTGRTVLCNGSLFNGNTIPSFDINTEVLILNNIKLDELPDYAFVKEGIHHQKLNNLGKLLLHNCTLHKISPMAFYGLDGLNTTHIVNSQLTNEGFLANSSYPLTKLVVLNLSGNRFEQIPASVFSMAPNLVHLEMANNRLKSVNLTNVADLTKLRKLHVNGNNLKSLDPTSFKFQNNSILVLQIEDCNITAIHNESFTQLPELIKLDLSGNPISTEDLTTFLQYLGVSTKLDYLELSNMKLPHLSPPMFSTLTNVTSLNISNSGVVRIESKTFAEMTSLKKLTLYKNGLARVPDVSSIKSLTSLNLSDNHIQELQMLKVQKNTLREIDVSHNMIRKVSHQWIINQNSVNLINLSHNNISLIDSAAFRAVNAVTVDLSHNQIVSTRDMGVMATRLDLSYNSIQHLTQEMMNKLYSVLDELNLSHNKISVISDDVFHDMTTLEKLDLSHNNMGRAFYYGHHINLFDHLQHMRELDLSYNGITSFPDDEQFENSAQLKRLNLSGNKIASFETFPCNSLSRSLQYLDLSNNNLKFIDRVCIGKMLVLKEADFSYNPFVCTCPLAEFTQWYKDTHHAPVTIIGLEDKRRYQCSGPATWVNKSILDNHPAMGTCDFHPRSDSVRSTVIGITVGLVLVGIIILVMVLYFSKVCQKMKNIRYNWQIRYKEVNEDRQVIL